MNKKLFILFLCFLSYKNFLYAQSNIDMPKVVPTSPTAASLGMYGNIPISLYTGLPNISIPIWNLKGRELNLPITLSYRAGGVKVEDMASWVGLGWSLDAGGVITRAVRGLPDFRNGNPGSRPVLPVTAANIAAKFDSVYNINLNSGTQDGEPDIFYYNFNGKSGSFFFDRAHVAHFSEFDDIKVEYSFVYNSGLARNQVQFKLTTSDGTQYLFYDKEISSNSDSEPDSWFLTQIISPSGHETFNFQYDNENFSYQLTQRDREYTSIGGGANARQIGDPGYVNITGKRLRRIVASSIGTIEFVPDPTARVDIYNYAYALKEIQIYNTKSELLRKFSFQMENIETADRIGYYGGLYPHNEYLNWRMYLKSLTEYDATGTISKAPYVFTYYDRNSSGKDLLPNRVSYAQDHWGYYNAKIYNRSLIPPYIGPFGTLDPQFDAAQPNCLASNSSPNFLDTANMGDRTPVFPAMRAGTLKSMQYPTGGHTDFEYEAHQGYYVSPDVLMTYSGIVGGLRIKSVTAYDNCNNVLTKKDYEYGQGGLVNFPKYRSYEYYNFGSQSIYQLCSTHPDIQSALYLKISSGSYTSPGSTKGSIIGYNTVTEIQQGAGSTVYNYTYPLIYPDDANGNLKDIFNGAVTGDLGEYTFPYYSYFSWPFQPLKNNDWKRGLLTQKFMYDQNGKPIHVESYVYDFNELGTVPAITTRQILPGHAYLYAEYAVPYGWSHLSQKVVTDYNGNANPGNQRSAITNYTYEPQFKYKQSETVIDSKGDSLKTTYTYPFNYATAPYTNMVTRNIVAPTVETKSYKNSTLLNTVTQSYKDWFSDQSVFAPELVQAKKGTAGTLDTALHYQALNTNGSLLSVSKQRGSNSSYIWGYNAVYPIAEVKNATNADIAYTSFESDDLGNWAYDNSIAKDTAAITGLASYDINSTHGISKSGLLSAQTYIVSYWSRNGSYNVNSSSAKTGKTAGAWTYYEHEVTGATTINVIGNGDIDELRLYPKGALMTTYCYKPLVGMISANDESNKITYYDYDGLGRMNLVKDQDKNILKSLSYNYNTTGTANCTQTVYYNVEKSQTFTRNNCTTGEGSTTLYKVSAQTFSSIISQANADSLAQKLVDTYGQIYANNTGNCTVIYYNDDKSGPYTAQGCGTGYNPTAVFVSEPAHTYSSLISKDDANLKAVTDAQNFANSRGCVVDHADITGSNTDNISGFQVKFVQDLTGVTYKFDLQGGINTLGRVAPGSYTITVANPSGTPNTYNFQVGDFTGTGQSVSYVSVNVNSLTFPISISLP